MSDNVRDLRRLHAILRGADDTEPIVSPSDDSGVPEKIMEAERWRLAGQRLRQLAPAAYERVVAMLVASLPNDNDESGDAMPKSYYLT